MPARSARTPSARTLSARTHDARYRRTVTRRLAATAVSLLALAGMGVGVVAAAAVGNQASVAAKTAGTIASARTAPSVTSSTASRRGSSVAAASTAVGTTTSAAAAASPGTVLHLWDDAQPAGSVVDTATDPVELGTRFVAKVAGTVTGVRFWKASAANAGTHTGTLWSASGKRLATATFTDESTQGWQTVRFSSPVAVTAGTTYVVSYFAPRGGYSATLGFTGTPGNSAAFAVTEGATGVYVYGPRSAFPTKTFRSAQYWVDVLFQVGTTTPTASPSSSPSSSPTSSSPTAPATPTNPSSPAAPSDAATPTTPTDPGTPTTPGTGGKGCAAVPSSCGFPDSTTTGVTDTSVLRTVPGQVTSGKGWHYNGGWIVVDTDGAVLENVITSDGIDVDANNVTIRNVRSTATGETWGIGLRHAKNTTITDTEILPTAGKTRLLVGIKDVYGDATGTTIDRVEITRTSTGIQIGGGLIEDSYVHDLDMISGDHVNGTTSNGFTTQLTIRHNTIFNKFSQTDAVSLFQDFGTEENRLIENNLLAGGGYTIYAGANAGKAATKNIVVRDNVVSTMYFPGGGSYGPATAYNPAGAGNVWENNTWAETGKVIPAPSR